MPRTPPPTPTSPKALYPVVKDLTDAEYGNSSGAGVGLCCNDMLGSFALEDLALPNIRALQMQQPPLVPPLQDLPESRVELKRRNSLIHSSAGAPLSSSSIGSDIPVPRNDDTASLTCMADDESHADTVSRRFDDSFVLTRQVCAPGWVDCGLGRKRVTRINAPFRVSLLGIPTQRVDSLGMCASRYWQSVLCQDD
jgi:hypothetical protein